MQMRTNGNVFTHRLGGEGLHDLKGAGHAQARIGVWRAVGNVLPGEFNPASFWRKEAGHQREERCFACSVGADQRREAALGYAEADILNRLESAKCFGNAVDNQNRRNHFGGPFHSARMLCPTPPSPWGANITIKTSTLP